MLKCYDGVWMEKPLEEEDCTFCDGIGFRLINDVNDDYGEHKAFCKYCTGSGKMDWITKIKLGVKN